MSQTELNDGLAAHMVKPGDEPLNPTGKQGSPILRMKNKAIKNLWREFGDTPCTEPGFEGMTWFEAHTLSVFRLYVYGEPWAAKEINTRVFGRVPLSVDASVTVKPGVNTSSPCVEWMSETELALIDSVFADAAHRMQAGEPKQNNSLEATSGAIDRIERVVIDEPSGALMLPERGSGR